MKQKIKLMDIDSLAPYPNNPKEHPEEQVELIAGSIQEYGFVQPIVVNEADQVIIGHGRLKAAKKIGLDRVPTMKADHLSDPQVKALRLADNRIAQTDWEDEKLAVEIEQLIEDEKIDDLVLGFDESEIDELLAENEEEGETIEGEVEFTEELHEEHNYVVLYFETDIDWLQIKSLLDLDTVKALDSREGFEKRGVGRVVNGPEALQKLKEELGG